MDAGRRYRTHIAPISDEHHTVARAEGHCFLFSFFFFLSFFFLFYYIGHRDDTTFRGKREGDVTKKCDQLVISIGYLPNILIVSGRARKNQVLIFSWFLEQHCRQGNRSMMRPIDQFGVGGVLEVARDLSSDKKPIETLFCRCSWIGSKRKAVVFKSKSSDPGIR